MNGIRLSKTSTNIYDVIILRSSFQRNSQLDISTSDKNKYLLKIKICMSSSRSIIVIDDEMELASLFKSFLEREGYGVVSFVDPLIALDFFKETSNKHSLVITDLRMPGICGIDLAIKMREINKNIHIFLMTAFETKDLRDQESFKQARFDRLIQKPVRFADLRNMINELWTNEIK